MSWLRTIIGSSISCAKQLHRYFPQLLQISSAAEDAWVWDLIEIAPVPAVACKLTRGRIERVLRRHRIRRLTSEEVMAALRLPALKLAQGSAEAASEHALLLLPRLRLIRKQRVDTATRIEILLNELSEVGSDTRDHGPERPTDVAVLRSLPGVWTRKIIHRQDAHRWGDLYSIRRGEKVDFTLRLCGKTHPRQGSVTGVIDAAARCFCVPASGVA